MDTVRNRQNTRSRRKLPFQIATFTAFIFLLNPTSSKTTELSKNPNYKLLPKGVWAGSSKTTGVKYKVAFCTEGNYWFTRKGGVSNTRVRFNARVENIGVVISVEEDATGKWIETLVYDKSKNKLKIWPDQGEGEAEESEFITLRKEKECPWNWEPIF